MRTTLALINILFTALVVVSLALEYDPIGIPNGQSVRHHIVKRKGRSGGRSRGSSRTSSRQMPKSAPYPKQPPLNPTFQQINHNHYPSNTGYAGQSGYNPNYGQRNWGSGGIMGENGHKSGAGGLLGAGATGGVAGAALGAYGGYKLGKMVGKGSHYGYFNGGHYHRCDPPRVDQIKWDSERNISYIPHDSNYDHKCHYYDRDPSHANAHQRQRVNMTYQINSSESFELFLNFILIPCILFI